MKLKDQCLLGIEGAGQQISLALYHQGEPAGMFWLKAKAAGSMTLLAGLDHLLAQCNLTPQDLQGICVSLGPGSFTSMRISLATAEALGLSLHLPLYGVDCLTLMAASLPYHSRPLRVVQNAYKGELYHGLFDLSQGKPKALEPLSLMAPERLLDLLQPGELVLGQGMEPLLAKGFDPSSRGAILDQGFGRQAHAMGVIEHFLDQAPHAPTGLPLEPVYIRLSEAELLYQKRFPGAL